MGAPSQLGFNLDQTFFGFKPEDQVQLHDNIYELIWAGEGRWDWDTIYNLPLHIRRYWITKINKMRDERNSAIAEQQEKLAARASSKTISRPKPTR
jgi:hypothetical protein